ncbi:MAG TPA: amidohydrolase family protein [Dehalococcoidia bacterium]|nr:amidohydrolase family protein [Dehalococcoidia bacterium]
MIVDVHTHVFPPEVAAERERYLAADATFRELYASPKAQLATAEDLLRSMDEARVDVSVALGFAWRDLDAVRRHNDYLLNAAVKSNGRILAFPALPLTTPDAIEPEMRRCVEAGARGFGELRPDNLGFDLAGEHGARLGRLARELGAVLLFHASEPVGHAYTGKQGGDIGALYEFTAVNPDARVIAAHLGGGLPFYVPMPEVRAALQNVWVDTAAAEYLYDATVYSQVTQLIGVASLVFGSDFPLLSQKRAIDHVEQAVPDRATRHAILGDNAAQLLRLE